MVAHHSKSVPNEHCVRRVKDRGYSATFYSGEVAVLTSPRYGRSVLSGIDGLLFREAVDRVGLWTVVAGALSGALHDLEDYSGVVSAIEDAEQRERTSHEELVKDKPCLGQSAMYWRLPLRAMVEINYLCNLRCPFCYVLHEVSARRPQKLTIEELSKVFGDLDKLGCLDVSITGGEPLADARWRQILDVALDTGMYTILKTNGLLLRGTRLSDFLSRPAQEVHLSLYGATEATHDSFIDSPGSFAKTLSAMSALKMSPVKVTVNATVWNGNVSETSAMRDIVEAAGHQIVFQHVIYGRLNGDKAPRQHAIRPDQRKKLIQDGVLETFSPKPCSAGAMKVKIAANGEVALCELLPNSVGNIRNDDLTTIWRNSTTRSSSAMYRELADIREPSSQNARRACPGLNLLNTGRLEGETVP